MSYAARFALLILRARSVEEEAHAAQCQHYVLSTMRHAARSARVLRDARLLILH